MINTHGPALRLVLAQSRLIAIAPGLRCPVSRLGSAYALWRDELVFARTLLSHYTRFWLFRAHQQCASGDFVIFDRSASAATRARVWAIELKSSARLRLWRRGMQLAHAESVVQWLAEHYAVLVRTTVPVIGNRADVLGLISA